eukprot:CAMPEP_0174747988 /NCGR_PEP_ID=MMETSP1094-20130205/92434_1 /TAXON_ID=156173 /ORGANISM="Chrysochromulina brevifilum, Strain UTEX LB 985" /LENGTH=53 /DNA_ID=CAMNT_0015952947 /DNA_START=59 /DNA_END=217 /DNA_ORIENTATION=+
MAIGTIAAIALVLLGFGFGWLYGATSSTTPGPIRVHASSTSVPLSEAESPPFL